VLEIAAAARLAGPHSRVGEPTTICAACERSGSPRAWLSGHEDGEYGAILTLNAAGAEADIPSEMPAA
jgi:hypothetical protein